MGTKISSCRQELSFTQTNGEFYGADQHFQINGRDRAIYYDLELYPDLEVFNPARWLSPKYPTTYREPLDKYPNLQNFSAFGFGRRSCPGMNIAENSLYILIARMA